MGQSSINIAEARKILIQKRSSQILDQTLLELRKEEPKVQSSVWMSSSCSEGLLARISAQQEKILEEVSPLV